MIKNLLIFIIAFLIATAVSPFVISLFKKFKAKQTILHYVKEHQSKQGTPTMGGVIFIFSTAVSSMFFLKGDFALAIISLVVMLSYGVLGFLDDFIKIRFKQNLGLRAYQKILGQLGISILIAMFVYKSNLIGTEIIIPFGGQAVDIGVFIVPFIIFVFLAVVNSVNLIDGLDGLSAGVSFVYLVSFGILIILNSQNLAGPALSEQNNLSLICFCMSGGLLAYLLFNCFPAKIFMGDTGSLALGGLITVIAIFSKLTLYIPIIGIMYALTAMSDIIQVLYYKKTKKRVFLMAPLHHHFQKKGVHENRIVTIYIVTTMMISIVTITLILIIGG